MELFGSIGWQASLQIFLQALSGILTAGIAITAFALFLYALAFNLRDRVARTFALILIFTVIVFTAESIGSIETSLTNVTFWLHLQWVGIVFLPAAYLHFSDALLATTGKPSKGRRRWAVRLVYVGSIIFLLGLPVSWLIGPVVMDNPPAPHLQPTLFTDIFVIFYLAVMAVSWVNFVRAYRRTTTSASRRRMFYLIAGSLAPAFGAFPFLPYGPNFAARHQLTFWALAVITNILVGIFLVIMAYAVAFFGVSWPERVVKTRLFKWIMRGPFTASLTLAATTLTRRAGESFGASYSALVPIVMVGTVLLSEYLITLFSPLAERWLFYGNDKSDLNILQTLESQLLTRNDLQQFLETVLAAARDRMQASGAYVVARSEDGYELVVMTGQTRFSEHAMPAALAQELLEQISTKDEISGGLFRWGEDYLLPLLNGTPESPDLIGLLGVANADQEGMLDAEQVQALNTLAARATLALRSRRIQQNIFISLEALVSGSDFIQRLRAAGQYDQSSLLVNESDLPKDGDLSNWVKDALSHYWGGPKLTKNPLIRFHVVQRAIQDYDGNDANALRAILRQAIEQIRPEGERRFTGEWILYNILEMKFMEGRKVREVAMRLAMSEADLYRKQRIAVEAVARAINEMELEARKEVGG